MIADVYSTSNRPPELFVQPNRAGAEMAQLTTSPTKEWLAFNWIAPEIVMVPASDGVQGAGAHLSAEGHARVSQRRRRALRAWRRIPAQRAQLLVDVFARVHVQPVSRVEGVRRARHRLSRLRRLRPRLAHGDLSMDGRTRSAGRRRRVEVSDRRSSASIPSASACTAAATVAS